MRVKDAIKNLAYLPRPATIQDIEYANEMTGSSGFLDVALKEMQSRKGVQVIVSKEVSDQMENTDLSADLDLREVPWLGECSEVYFEDPMIPTLLVSYQSISDFEGLWDGLDIVDYNNVGKDTKCLRCLMEQPHTNRGRSKHVREANTLYLPQNMMNSYFKDKEDCHSGSSPFLMTEEEHDVMRRLVLMAIKVMYFASHSHYTEPTRKQLRKGGKDGVKNRPKRPSKRVEYLPRFRAQAQDDAQAEEGKKRFLGRRGVFRVLRSPKFTRKRGQTIYVPPIPNPETGEYPKKVFKVRCAG